MCIRELNLRFNSDFKSKFNGKSLAAFFVLTCATLFSATAVHAQSISELQKLAFYPVPLDKLDTARAVVAPGGVADIGVGFHEPAPGSYLKRISDIQGQGGAYAPELTEQGASAGLRYQQQNQHDEALGSLELAAASSRIHNGLYSSEQIFLAEHTIKSLIALDRLDEAQDKYEQLLNISRKFYGPRAAETAHALLGLGQLQLDRLQRDLAQTQTYDGNFDTLYQAQAHFVDATRILIDNAAWTDPAIFALEQNLIRTYYMDAVRARAVETPLSYLVDDESSHSRMRSRANRVAAPEQYFKGEQAYLRMFGYLEKNPNPDNAEIGNALLGLADWNLLFGNEAEADEHYRRFEQLAGAAPEAAAMLASAVPVTLPAFVDSGLAPRALPEDAGTRGYVDVSFNVDRHGRAIDVDVLGASDGAARAVVSQLERLVRNSRFRPAIDAGADFRLRYYFSY